MTTSDFSRAGQRNDDVGRAVEVFLRHRAKRSMPEDEARLDAMAADPTLGRALQHVERTWNAVADCADSPEIMVLREQALGRARKASLRRWRVPSSWTRARVSVAAAAVGAVGIAAVVWQLTSYGPYALKPIYRTGFGEQRTLELADRSTIALDANTKIRVRYSSDARIVEIAQGQAQFSVASDPSRPFKVVAGEHTVVALGTVFTVEYVEKEIRLAMLDGRVAVFPPESAGARESKAAVPIEVNAGEALRVDGDGRVHVTPHADIAAATAWRQGQVIFHDEPLAEAVRRLNRYSRVRIEVKDPSLAQLSISGLFDAGDTRAFANALQSYLPVAATYVDSDTIELRSR